MVDMKEKITYVFKLYLLIALTVSLAYLAGLLFEWILPLAPVFKDFGITEVGGYTLGEVTWNYLYIPFAIFLAVVHWFLSLRRDLDDEEEQYVEYADAYGGQ
jgi:hypothetical protein